MVRKMQREGTDKKGKDNYETSSSATHYGKGSITRPTNYEAYASNWDRIFGKKKDSPIVG